MHHTELLAKRDIQDITALTPLQEGMLFHYLVDPSSGHYFEQLSLEMTGALDTGLFEEAWNSVIRANEVLRTVFRWNKLENPVRMVLKTHRLEPRYIDISHVPGQELETHLEKIREADRKESFDLMGVAFRVTLCKMGPQRYRMMVSNHHILMDGWSTGIVLKEFFRAYRALRAGEPLPVRTKTSFKEFVRWTLKKNDGESFEQQRGFWSYYLQGVEPGTLTELSIKSRQERVEAGRSHHCTHQFRLDEGAAGRLERFSRERKITLAAIFYSAWGLLLQTYTNSRDVVFGTTVSGRSARIKGIEDMVGLFIGTLPFRLDAGAGETISALLQRAEEELQAREAFEHSSLANINRFCGLDQRQELFDTLVVLENYPLDRALVQEPGAGAATLTPGAFRMEESAHYDLTVSITVFDGIQVNFIYNGASLNEPDIRRMGVYLGKILTSMVAHPEKGAGDTVILTLEEKRQILEEFNGTQTPYPSDKSIPQLFREQAEKIPDCIAIVGNHKGKKEVAHLTYRELNRRSLAVGRELKLRGLEPGGIAALLAERSVETVIVILGILNAGAAYLPIDPGYPRERIGYMLKDSNAEFVLTDTVLTLKKGDRQENDSLPGPSGTAYVIYTSGTTGRPKGVMVEHGNVVRLVKNSNYVGLNEGERLLQTGALEFDASTFEIWGALLNGLSLYVVPRETVVSVRALKEAVRKFDIVTMWMTVSLFNQVSVSDIEVFAGLRNLVVGGDVLSPFHINRLSRRYPGLNIINGYGPTENTTFSTTHRIDGKYAGPIPIGKPIANSTAYILDSFGRPQPLNVAGELWVGGRGVARGYMNQPELTAERFVDLNRSYGSYRTYKTGDLARWLTGGIIEFLGRIDQQVKLRGFRIEPGEIEDNLLMHPGVNEAVVLARSAPDNDKYLCAYFTSEKPLETEELRDHLGKTLPDYMIPAYFVQLEVLPLTPNGKIHRQALPEPKTGAMQGQYAAPRSETEEKLVELWQSVLGQQEGSIGIDDDFFRLGGHSLKATRLASMIHKRLDLQVSPASIFEAPTIRKLAAHLEVRVGRVSTGPVERAERKEYYPLSLTQQSFFAMHQTHEDATLLNMPLILSFKRGEAVDSCKMEAALRRLVERHDALRTSFHMNGEQPVQQIQDTVDFTVENIGPIGPIGPINNSITDFIRPFDLAQAPLFRAMIVSSRAGNDLLILDMHHLVADGTSQEILVRELGALYFEETAVLPVVEYRYGDFLHWRDRQLETGAMHEHERYWLERLSGPLPVMTLPADHPRPRLKEYRGDSFGVPLEPELYRDIQRLCVETGATLYMVLLAVFNILLSKYTGQTDIIVGSPAANRDHPAWEGTVGLFMNALMMRNFPGKGKTFGEFLAQVKTSTLEAYAHQSYPMERLLEQLDVKTLPGRNPVTDVSLNLLNNFGTDLLEQWSGEEYRHKTAKVDLTLTALERNNGLELIVEYDISLFKRQRMEQLAGHFRQILWEVTGDPQIPIWKIDMITSGEKLAVVGHTGRFYPLSHAQKRIYYPEKQYPGTAFATLAFTVRCDVEEGMDVDGERFPKLEKAIHHLLATEDGLRLRLAEPDGVEEPYQYVAPFEALSLDRWDFSGSGGQEKLAKQLERETADPFPLEGSPFYYFALVKYSRSEYGYYCKFHHLVADGWTTLLLVFNRIDEYYRSLEAGDETLPVQRPSYLRYLADEQEYMASPQFGEDRRFWHETLLPLPLEVKLTEKSGDSGDIRCRSLKWELPEPLYTTILDFSSATGASLYKILFSALALVTASVSRVEDLVIGSANHNRSLPHHKEMSGMFVSTIPIRIRTTPGVTFARFLERNGRIIDRIIKNHQRYPFDLLLTQLKEKTGTDPGYLLDINLVGHADYSGDRFRAEYCFSGHDSTPLSIHVFRNKARQVLELEWIFQLSRYHAGEIETIHHMLITVLENALAQPETRISEISLLWAVEKERILEFANGPQTSYPEDSTLHHLIRERTGAFRDRRSVASGHLQVTYGELEQRADLLAHSLVEKGVGPGAIVAVKMERSIEMIVAILGVLESGAAYLPIDPEYPQDRIDYMQKDSNAALSITADDVKPILTKGLENISMMGAINCAPTTPTHLCYIIYTSGTTGRPKGVAVRHCNIVAYLWSFLREIRIEPEDIALQQASYAFDTFGEEVYPVLLKGGAVVIPPAETVKDADLLTSYLWRRQVTIVDCSPLLLNELNKRRLPGSLRLCISGGDVLRGEYIGQLLAEGREVYNTYGPTETTICATFFKCGPTVEPGVPIGKPIGNYRVMIVDSGLRPLPVGPAGELCIGGAGVAAGYLNQPELTAARFVYLNRSYGSYRTYKTGDLARWLAGGVIEFLGRIDRQVNIRGYRIELEEIRRNLLTHGAVTDAVVIAKERTTGDKYLCAYIVSDGAVTGPLPVNGLRGHLEQVLPAYMVPAHFVPIPTVPHTPNGKLDEKALPEPGFTGSEPSAFCAPRTPDEAIIAGIWAEVLGRASDVGIDDNFFEMGGDSIIAIQVSSRLKKHGLDVKVSDLFHHQTIRRLTGAVALKASNRQQPVSREIVTGESPLTPVQHWFFGQEFTHSHHFNQAMMLFGRQGFDESMVRRVWRELTLHHDALRLVYNEEDGRIVQYNRGGSERDDSLFYIETIDLTGLENNETGETIRAEATRIQSGMDLENGPLVRLGLFKTAGGHHLLVAIHHLVVDGVSWRILLEDFSAGYRQLSKGEPVHFGEKTCAYRDWALELSRLSGTADLLSEEIYWKRIVETPVELLPRDHIPTPAEKIQANVGDLEIQLDETATRQLLTQVNRAYNTEINDILLTALGLAVADWAGIKRVAVTLEGHGRDGHAGNMDVTRTVGWFTTRFPVILDMEESSTLARSIIGVKETLRTIPAHGSGYGILRYLSGENVEMEPEIGFNYLGQFTQLSEEPEGDGDHHTFTFSRANSGYSHSRQMEWKSGIEINGIVTGDCLTMVFSFNRREFDEGRIRELSERYSSRLREIIRHCNETKVPRRTPSDMDLRGLSLEKLEQMQRHVRQYHAQSSILNVYPLSPMQSGILFHYLMNPGSDAYFEQSVSTLRGSVEPELMKRSLEELIARHDIFRTLYFHEYRDRPVQAVLDRVEADFRYKDVSMLPEAERDALVLAVQKGDRQEKFHLETQVPLKMTLIRTGQELYRLVFSYHHIQVDGWAMGIVFKELVRVYRHLRKQEAVALEPAVPYARYIRWLENRDRETALDYWREYLEGYDVSALLPGQDRGATDESGDGHDAEYILREYIHTFDSDFSRLLRRMSGQTHATVNTIFQTAWGILLQRYNFSNDVVFGSVVSGRPPEIDGIENMVGLFINALPVRVRCDEPGTLLHLMEQLGERSLAAVEHGYLPLTDIQSLTPLNRRLISHIIVFENYPVQQELQSLGPRFEAQCGFRIEDIGGREQTNYDFNIVVMPGEPFRVNFNYNGAVLGRDDVTGIAGRLEFILRQVLADPSVPPDRIETLSQGEKETILTQFNRKDRVFTSQKTLAQMVEEQADKFSDQCSVVSGQYHITYRELDRRANRLSRELQHKGVCPGSIVAIKTEPSIEMMVGIIAILKAGAAYLPIAPDYPQERIDYMMADSNAIFLLGTDDLAAAHPAPRTLQPATGKIGSSNLAYIIYTSGTTGRPKGVPISHRNISPLLHWGRRFGIGRAERTLRNLSYIFDWSVWEVFITLTCGAALYIAPGDVLLNPVKSVRYMNTHGITVLHATPSQYRYMANVPVKPGTLRYLFLGAETLTWELVEKVFASVPGSCRVFNMYGPTECTIISSTQEISRDRHEPYRGFPSVPIGTPGANLSFLILDKHRQPCPVNIPGELYITGDGVAAGYLNNPELTAEKFVLFKRSYGSYRTYKTGDLARWLPGGVIEFLGRIDRQVKIRGYRIELAEIESRILEHPGVEAAVVQDLRNGSGETYLYAYFAAKAGVNTVELRSSLAKTLPDYMIPSGFMELDKLPLTPSGKIHRKSLPEPGTGAATLALPETAEQEQLAAIWAGVLDIPEEQMGIDSDFFNLGGHSLKATVLAAEIHRHMNIKVQLKDIFTFPTIRLLAGTFPLKKTPERDFDIIPPVEQQDYYPLSSAQKRLFILDQMDPGSVNYNIFTALLLTGEVDLDRFQDVFRLLIMRHESLRTSFHMMGETPVQRIHDSTEFSIEEIGSIDSIGPINSVISNFVRPFDLVQEPLIRVGLIRQDGDRHIMVLDMHHIVSDGMSMSILVKDFTAFYGDKDAAPAPLRSRYRDYAAWNRKGNMQNLEQQEQYWLDLFAGEIPVLDLPYDYPRPVVQSFEGDVEIFEIGEQETALLNRLARQEQTTLFVVLMTAYSVLLSKLSGSDDILVGTPVMGRRHAQLLDIVGMFVNMVVLRSWPEPGITFHQLLSQVHEHAIEAFENQEYPFEELVENTGVQRDVSRNPLFDASLVLQNMDVRLPENEFRGLHMVHYPMGSKTSKFDITFNCAQDNGKLVIAVEYATRLFKGETIRRFARYFERVAATIAADADAGRPDRKIGDIDILPEQEKYEQLIEFNRTAADYPRDKTLHRIFEEQVAVSPGNMAVAGYSILRKDEVQITYEELNARADRLAIRLCGKGVVNGDIVALTLEPSIEMITAIWGVLKAGAAYLPIDPGYPRERIDYMLNDSNAKLLLTTDDLTGADHATHNSQPAAGKISSADLAYIIYTSGTTGRPKGAMIEHRSVVRLMVNQQFQFDFNNRDTWTMFHSYCFDFSVWEMYGASLYGGLLIMVPRMTAKDPEGYLELLKRHQVTILNQTPSAFYNLISLETADVNRRLNIRYVIFGGEELKPSNLIPWTGRYPETKLINMYGITETTVHVTFKELSHRDIRLNISNIGRPIPTLTAYIMDRGMKLLPKGVPGELYIGGDGVARGYLNQPELTAGKFVIYRPPLVNGNDPCGQQPARTGRLYKSGDLARYTADGDMEYLGRIDHQVKIRGFRIELGEIENRLLQHPDVSRTLVLAKTDHRGEKYLCAYIISRKGPGASTLRKFLGKDLPDYMIPSYFVQLETMPVTPNGKIDRRALPEPGTVDTGSQSASPRTAVEKILADIWMDVLSLSSVGIDDDFFDIGGHSLKATILISLVYKELGVKIPLADIFRLPTIRTLSETIITARRSTFGAVEAVEKREYYHLSPAQKQLYVLQQMEPDNTHYNIPTALLLEGELDPHHLENAFRQLIRRHESLRTSFVRVDEAPVQRIHKTVDFEIEFFHATASGREEQIHHSKYIIQNSFIRAFDLAKAPLMRVGLIRLEADLHTLVVDIHHIVSDGTSTGVMVADFMAFYSGRGDELQELSIHYKDFTYWQERRFNGGSGLMNKQAWSWKEQFSGDIPELKLPTDFPRPEVQRFEGGRLRLSLSPEVTAQVTQLASTRETTLYMTLLAAFNILLAKLSGEEDIVVGSPIANRRHPDLEPIIGMFVNTLALRNFPRANLRFCDFLAQLRRSTLNAYENQEYPLEELVAALGLQGKSDRNPLFDAMFVFQNLDVPELEMEGLKLKPLDFETGISQFDLIFLGFPARDKLEFLVLYRTSLFKEETVQRFIDYYNEILQTVLANDEIEIGDITISYGLEDARSQLTEEASGDFIF